YIFFFSSRRRHTRFSRDWSSDVCSSDLTTRISSPASHPASQKASLWTGPRAGVLRCATRTSRGWVPAELCPFFSLRAEGRSLPPHFSATLPETSVNEIGRASRRESALASRAA